MPQTPSTRWCPTPEQLMILEEMYRNGVRNPSASQIQQITAHLSLYGKIEGKNVFYWFQNHKARDRQKLRRQQSDQEASNSQDAAETQEMNLVGKLESGETESQGSGTSSASSSMEGFSTVSPCCRPLKTLNLFPTGRSAARNKKDEYSSSKSPPSK